MSGSPMKRRRRELDLFYPPDPSLGTTQHIILRKVSRKKQPKRPKPNTEEDDFLNFIVSILKFLSLLLTPFIRGIFSKRGLLFMISVLVGAEAGRSKGSFCLAAVSFLGGAGQKNSLYTILVFLGGFLVGVDKLTIYAVLGTWLIAYACQLHAKDVVLLTVAYGAGLMSNMSNHVFLLAVLCFLGGQAVRYDKEFWVYVGLSVLIASRGELKYETLPFYTRLDMN